MSADKFIFLTCSKARRVILDLFTLCPNAKIATEIATEEIEKVIKSLGLQKKRAKMIQRFSQEYLEEHWTYVTELHGIGKQVAIIFIFDSMLLSS